MENDMCSYIFSGINGLLQSLQTQNAQTVCDEDGCYDEYLGVDPQTPPQQDSPIPTKLTMAFIILALLAFVNIASRKSKAALQEKPQKNNNSFFNFRDDSQDGPAV